MKKLIFPVTLVLLLAAGCAKEAPSDRDIPIQLSVSLEGSTKATHEEAGTIMDLDLIVRDKKNDNYSFASTRFYRDGSSWKSDTKRLWSSHQTTVDILCLSPSIASRSVSITDDNSSPLFSWEVESVQTAGSYASDLLTSIQANSNPNLTIDNKKEFGICLHHAMSLLRINVELATEFNALGVPQTCPLEHISIAGLKLKGDYYSVLNGTGWNGLELRPVDGSEGSITSYITSYTPSQSDTEKCSAVYECIVLPQAPVSFSVKVGTGTKDISFSPTLPSGFKFEAGKIYTLKLKVGKDKIESSNTIYAGGWNGHYSQDLDDEKS